MPYDAFLKLDGVPGESKDEQHNGWIDILSFSWGVKQTKASGSGGGAGKAMISDLTMTKRVDKATPLLVQNVINGRHAATGMLSVRKAGASTDFLKYSLSSVLVSSLTHEGNTRGDSTPLEQLELGFLKISVVVSDTPVG